MPIPVKSVLLFDLGLDRQTSLTTPKTLFDFGEVNEIDFATVIVNITQATGTSPTLDIAFEISWDAEVASPIWYPVKQRQSSTTVTSLGTFLQITATGLSSIMEIPIPAGINGIRATATVGGSFIAGQGFEGRATAYLYHKIVGEGD